MAKKDLEKLIEDFVVPEMEYSPAYDKLAKKTAYGVTIDDVPEVVLPKSRAEMLEEAKERLSEVTSASPKRRRRTVEPRQERQTAPPKKNPVKEPAWVGGAEEIVPFAWRNPLIPDISKPNKLYRQAVKSESAGFLPVPHGK